MLAPEVEGVEDELSKSGPISLVQLSSDPRMLDDAPSATHAQGLEGSKSSGPHEIKGKEPPVDLSSSQGVNVAVE